MSRLALALLVLLAGSQLTGCATVLASKYRPVMFTSEPTDAEVLIDGRPYGRTPLQVTLPNKDAFTVTFRRPGLPDRSYTMGCHVPQGWVILDFLAGIFPIIVDSATGAWTSLDDSAVHGVLAPSAAPTDSAVVPSAAPPR